MNYQLNKPENQKKRVTFSSAVKRLWPFLKDEKRNLTVAFVAILATSVLTLLSPVIISYTIDTYIQHKDFQGVLVFAAILLVVNIAQLVSSYTQTKTMGGVGRRTLFSLRNAIFTKLQELPVAFFNQNKAGDLISRINNDTDILNQFFSQALMQFVGNAFLIAGAGVFLVVLNDRLGAASLVPALGVLIITQLVSAWVKQKSLKSLQALGGMSAEIQESLANFKVIVAFNRLDYFARKFSEVNEKNFSASVSSGLASGIFVPLYGLASNLAQLIVLAYGIYLIGAGDLTIGLLVAFFLYVNSFYSPLRQMAAVWSSFQLALASFDRISEVLALRSDLNIVPQEKIGKPNSVLEFKNVFFKYPEGKEVLRDVNFILEKGKTYALVGPTGGGKTTTASLMARLYDPTSGTIFLDRKDIRSYKASERTQKIGFILQEPFLFTGTVRENILYGNEKYRDHSAEHLDEILKKANYEKLLARFDKGLNTHIKTSSEGISLGQKQLIAFMRAVLREPEILILDEATANIDTVTEQLLTEILNTLPSTTTKVIIAHRLNTIKNADEIFFVNASQIVLAGSMECAVDLLLHGKREG
jgi:ATP-binding cassette subfamily B protein